ncbi:MAG TPA: DUF6789 family protein [Bdellovibrionales bacterium]|nr:DUF6789 family protein [Bdellovibrionales bacterium]
MESYGASDLDQGRIVMGRPARASAPTEPSVRNPYSKPLTERRSRVDLSYKIYEAGFVATLVMTFVAYAPSILGMAGYDIAASMATAFENRPVIAGEGMWWVALVVHLLIGTYALPTLYHLTIYQLRPAYSWRMGLVWGVVLWAFEALMLSLLNFETSLGVAFLSWLTYGFVFGYVAEPHANRLQYRETGFGRRTGRTSPAA